MRVRRGFIRDPSLVLYLPLYKLDGASFMSKDAYGHLCTVTGALWGITGRTFDGDDKITILNTGFDPAATGFTWMAWANANALDADRSLITFHNPDHQLRYDSGDDFFELQLKADGAWNYTKYSQANPSTSTWYNVAGVADLTGSPSASIYVNGIVGDTTASFTTIDATVTPDVYLGCTTGSGRYWKGYIGEVWIYNRALSAAEIQHNHRVTKWRYS